MNPKRQNLSSKSFFNILLINHLIIILIVLGLGAFHYLFSLFSLGSIEISDLNHPSNYWSLGIFVVLIFLSQAVYSKSLDRIRNLDRSSYILRKKIEGKKLLILKMGHFRSAVLIRLIGILAPSILTPILVETNPVYFLCLILSILYVLATIPTKRRVVQSLVLQESEVQRINNPKAIVARRTYSFGIGNAQQWRY